MNTIKRLNLSIALLITFMFFLTNSLFAQQRQEQGPPPIPNAAQINKMVQDLSAELSLTKAQETKILALYTDHFAEVKSSTGNSAKRVGREEMEKQKQVFENKVKSLLNDEQKDLFDEFINKNKPQQGQGGQRQQKR